MTGQELIDIIKKAGAENVEVFVCAEYINGNEFACSDRFGMSLMAGTGVVKGYNYADEEWTKFSSDNPERLVITVNRRSGK